MTSEGVGGNEMWVKCLLCIIFNSQFQNFLLFTILGSLKNPDSENHGAVGRFGFSIRHGKCCRIKRVVDNIAWILPGTSVFRQCAAFEVNLSSIRPVEHLIAWSANNVTFQIVISSNHALPVTRHEKRR
jgi:hypothetical protein